MRRPMMVQPADERRIEALKERLQLPTKIGVVRAALDLLEKDADRRARIERGRHAAHRAAASSRAVNADFRKHSRLGRS